MDHKNTLNLPRTDFPMQAGLVQREPARFAEWHQSGLHRQILDARAGAPRFILHDGPPFANGDVHIGTALNKILKDLVIRYKSLRGFQAPYVPGWDCHGLPIESKVTQELRAAGRTDADPGSIRSACQAYAEKYVRLQREQFKRLGILGDWDHPYLTLTPQYEADELRLFADLVERGYVYRGRKPVYWSIPFKTALAEAEVEYRDHVSKSVYVKFPVTGEPNTHLLIWTTTPWTLPANLAVAFNPKFHYSIVFAQGNAFILANNLLSAVSQKCGWEGYQIIRTLHADELATLTYQHPFCQRSGKLHPADFVDDSTGTGFVHIAPGHGQDDYLLGLRVGLPVYNPVSDDGLLVHTQDLPAAEQMPASLLGRSVLEKGGRSEANDAVIALLAERDALIHQEDYPHSYPHCWRSKTPVVFRAVNQWFIKVDHTVPGSTRSFRALAVETIGTHVHWVPDWGANRIRGAVESRPDWCISRQRTWGVPIPAFHDTSGSPILDANVVRRAADLIEQHGSNYWFTTPDAELWKQCRPESWAGPEAAGKFIDTLDVWIDSGSSSRAVLMRLPQLQHTGQPEAWRADMYLEGSDQHRGWFQSSLLLSLAGNGAAPFRTVLTHGFMVDEDREKISKSRESQGGYVKPQTADRYIKEYGADVLRLWVASQDYRNDIVVSEERLRKVGETYRLLRNTLRYQLSNLYDFVPARDTVADEALTGLDRWILGEFATLERDVAAAYDAFEFHVVYQRIAQFASTQLSAVYHDIAKDRLYTDPAGSPRRRSTQTTLYRLVQGLCRMLSPILVFTADEAFSFIPGNPANSIHLETWKPAAHTPGAPSAEIQADWENLMALRQWVLPELEKARQAKQIGKALDAAVEVVLAGDLLSTARHHLPELQEILNVSALDVREGTGRTCRISTAPGTKCSRCWHVEIAVGADPRHPELCPRCAGAVSPGDPAA